MGVALTMSGVRFSHSVGWASQVMRASRGLSDATSSGNAAVSHTVLSTAGGIMVTFPALSYKDVAKMGGWLTQDCTVIIGEAELTPGLH